MSTRYYTQTPLSTEMVRDVACLPAVVEMAVREMIGTLTAQHVDIATVEWQAIHDANANQEWIRAVGIIHDAE